MKRRLPLLSLLLTIAAIQSPAQVLFTGAPTSIEFSSFLGTGFVPTPAAGQLDSDTWRVSGLSDGATTFGGTFQTGDYARGLNDGNVTTGGVYAFTVAPTIVGLGIQPGEADFTPGAFILRIQNQTGATLTSLDVSYAFSVNNDEGRSNAFNFGYSFDDVSYTNVTGLDFASAAAADAIPAWTPHTRQTVLSLNVADNDFVYLRWLGDDVSGSGSRDEFALTSVTLNVPEPSTYAAIFGLISLGVVVWRRRRSAV